MCKSIDAVVRERLIVKNPTDSATIPKNNYAPKQILTEAQLEKFMHIAMQDEVWRDFFYTELTMGLRLGEICGLRWSDFDEATGRLKISRTMKRKKGGVTWGDTKTETGMRNILLPPSTAEVLRERRKTSYSEWIFPNIYRPEDAAKPPVNSPCASTEPHPEPTPRKIRKSGTGCLYQINDNLWEGSFFPRLPSGKRKKFNVYAETKKQCEIKLAEMIAEKKAEIAEEKERLIGKR